MEPTILPFDPHNRPPAQPTAGPLADGADVDLTAILSAWQEATERLRVTHESLRAEVRRLTDELEAKNRELARQNRLADLGQMASHVAHEVRNGLVPMTLYLSLLRRHVGDHDPGLSILDKLTAGFTALEVTVNDLLQFTADRDPQWGVFELSALVREVCDGLAPQLDAQGIQQDLDLPAGLMVCADREMMRRAVLNLVLNAIEVMPRGGELAIAAWQDQHGIELEIADSGPGLEQPAHGHLFEPFYTTKKGGTGLGLTIVERIATAHHGSVLAQNCPQGGAAFTIRIPYRALGAAA